MEGRSSSGEEHVVDFVGDEEEEFCSCCGEGEEEDEWRDTEELTKEGTKVSVDEFCLKMFFKGVSLIEPGDSGSGFTGIGVVVEKSPGGPVLQVQKKLDFYVEESVAEYLALMDGLVEALRNNIRQVVAFTDSKIVYDQASISSRPIFFDELSFELQLVAGIIGKDFVLKDFEITHDETVEDQLLEALKERVLEHAGGLECFVLKIVPTNENQRSLLLAQVAIGIVCSSAKGDGSVEDCPICCDERSPFMMVTMNCTHKFCSRCMRTYVEGKLQSGQVPIRCPQPNCKYYVSASECKTFLPVTCYELLEKAFIEANFLDSEKIYCPFPNCSVLLNPRQCLSSRASSSSTSDGTCVECPECQRFICLDCGVPWHSSMSCQEYQNLPMEERDAGDITLHRLAQNNRWRRCQQCRRMIELTQGCYHMTCWCRHEFCYSCGAEYRDGQQTCQCAFWDESLESPVAQNANESNPWGWDSFDSFPMIMDAYSDQERSQLALIQRFLAGGFGLSDHHPYQSPPQCSDSYVDTMKDLHQLPWLERFVSVINYEDYIQ
ncbi:hypothetical protein Sjap_003776 [Stephania japonica]|uniref:RBR-type E3 ubiquitin transferase n=1 Tax=Stephania japonica TaxID=461633 RepID=A0AAP0PXI5_9MAGN